MTCDKRVTIEDKTPRPARGSAGAYNIQPPFLMGLRFPHRAVDGVRRLPLARASGGVPDDRAIWLAGGRNSLARLRLKWWLHHRRAASRRQQLRLRQPRKIEEGGSPRDLERSVLSPGLVWIHLRLQHRRRAHPARLHHVLQQRWPAHVLIVAAAPATPIKQDPPTTTDADRPNTPASAARLRAVVDSVERLRPGRMHLC
mmetsp:Transcript_827/g.1696  ORF Transcript_827/g.1696 Transcript_827/m.1696 type:complete len:200 (-) Transcript_827:425-1024(-)